MQSINCIIQGQDRRFFMLIRKSIIFGGRTSDAYNEIVPLHYPCIQHVHYFCLNDNYQSLVWWQWHSMLLFEWVNKNMIFSLQINNDFLPLDE